MTTPRKLQFTGALIVLSGIALAAPYAYFWHQNKVASASPSPTISIPAVAPLPEPRATLITGKPIQIDIPSLGYSIAIADGAYNTANHTWTLSKDKAHYALPSTQPNNETGNTLIYGHNRKEVFSKLPKLEAGALVYVTTDNGYKFTYTYKYTEKFNPNDPSIFAYEGAPRLTLQTCTGAWMQHRQMFYADFTSVEKL